MAEPVKSNIQKSLGKNFSMDGLGTGFGSGTGSGGLGLGTSTVSFFGIKPPGNASPSSSIFRAAWSRTRKGA